MATEVEDRVDFQYRLTEFGWSESRLRLGNRRLDMTASYLSDALGNLPAALDDLSRGAQTAQVSWNEEPGEYRWLLKRDGDDLTVRVLWFDAIPEDALPEEQGEERLRGRCRLDALVRAVAAGARAVLDEHGERGYLKRWDQHPFPTALLERLETPA